LQHIVNGRLLGTPRATKRQLQSQVGSKTLVNQVQATDATQHTDETLFQFVRGLVLDSLLSNLHMLFNRLKEMQGLELDPECTQTSPGSKVIPKLR
jgi:hypothetical protein